LGAGSPEGRPAGDRTAGALQTAGEVAGPGAGALALLWVHCGLDPGDRPDLPA
ncbi:unnamed protein product, partial [Effrenium voratum]